VLEYDEGFKFEASSLRTRRAAEPAPSKIGYRNSKLGAPAARLDVIGAGNFRADNAAAAFDGPVAHSHDL